MLRLVAQLRLGSALGSWANSAAMSSLGLAYTMKLYRSINNVYETYGYRLLWGENINTPAAAPRFLEAGSSAANAAFTSMGSPNAVPVPCICSVPTCDEQLLHTLPSVQECAKALHMQPEDAQLQSQPCLTHSRTFPWARFELLQQ